MSPGLQQRHFDYVLGPNQDARLAAVANGSTITGIVLKMDLDAPFVLTSRAVRRQYQAKVAGGGSSIIDLSNLRTRWTGPNRDYRVSGAVPPYLRESLQMAYYGMFGNPKPIVPPVVYPPGSVLMLDLRYDNPTYTPIALSFYFRGYKLYPPDVVPAYTYPRRMASMTYAYPNLVPAVGINETRLSQFFTVNQDADFVLRGGQGPEPTFGSSPVAEIAIRLRDFNKMPYSNDYMPFEVLFGRPTGAIVAATETAQIAVGSTLFEFPFGSGPGAPGLFYPEIYVPKNRQLIYDIQRSDGTVLGATATADIVFSFLGSKVFDR